MTEDTDVSRHRGRWLRLFFDVFVVLLFFLLVAAIHSSVSILQLLRFVDYLSVVS